VADPVTVPEPVTEAWQGVCDKPLYVTFAGQLTVTVEEALLIVKLTGTALLPV
jgi:hypothetical protein